jgi:hypothetical protein
VDSISDEKEGVNPVAELEWKSKEAGRLAYTLKQDLNHACRFARTAS